MNRPLLALTFVVLVDEVFLFTLDPASAVALGISKISIIQTHRT